MTKAEPFLIGGIAIQPGERRYVDLPLPPLYTHTSVAMPVHIVHGKKPGPALFLTAAIHGDEINGIEIIRRLLESRSLKRLNGTLVAVPVVNVFGFVSQSRYLPDRRDLNRSFPGSDRGSMASRLADTLIQEIVQNCTHGIDFHTATSGRTNLPQIRLDLEQHGDSLGLAKAFAAPIIIDMPTRDGTLRAAAKEIPLLLYEAGEALRFDEVAIKAGVQGTLRVMRHLNMLPALKRGEKSFESFIANDSTWMRAPQSGILRTRIKMGATVNKGDVLGVIADPFGESEQYIKSSVTGILIGMTNMPLVHEGEALFHVANTSKTKMAAKAVDEFHMGYEEAGDAH
ncbi:MAG: succinylglutamate desuccinylase/aspartoacylase family protein [Gammaproteobacteria bacterium]|nr:succinylglutamate desuccinylase/aspartoacylase family protein [Gammaproteobacteria bacterium]